MRKTTTMILIFLSVLFLLVSGCGEFAGNALMRLMNSNACIAYGKTSCEGNVLKTTTQDTACNRSTVFEDCPYGCRQTGKIAVCLTAKQSEALGRGMQYQAGGEGKSPAKQCSNTLDDDGDGYIDHPADLGCTNGNDDSEAGEAAGAYDTPGGDESPGDDDTLELIVPDVIENCVTEYGAGYTCVADVAAARTACEGSFGRFDVGGGCATPCRIPLDLAPGASDSVYTPATVVGDGSDIVVDTSDLLVARDVVAATDIIVPGVDVPIPDRPEDRTPPPGGSAYAVSDLGRDIAVSTRDTTISVSDEAVVLAEPSGPCCVKCSPRIL